MQKVNLLNRFTIAAALFAGMLAPSAVLADFGVNADSLKKFDCLDASETPVACGTGAGDGIGEYVIPRIIEMPQENWFAIRFFLREVGQYDMVHGTQPLGTNYPAVPCSSPEADTVYKESDDILFRGNPTRKRVHALAILLTSCWESGYTEYKEAEKVVFYSANVIDNSGAAILTWDNEEAVDLMFADNYGGTSGKELGNPDGNNEVTIFTIDENGNGKFRTFGFVPTFPTWIRTESPLVVDQRSDNPTNPSSP